MINVFEDSSGPNHELAAQTLQRKYDRVSKDWHRKIERLGYTKAYTELIDAAYTSGFLSKYSKNSRIKIMDMGTGTGALSRAFLEHTGDKSLHLDLYDLSEPMLEIARTHNNDLCENINTYKNGIGNQNIPENSYDIILCAHVIEHLEEPQQAINWLATRLKSGGIFILAVSKPHWCTSLIRWIWGNKAFSPQTILGMLEKSGLKKTAQIYFSSGPPSRTSAGYIAE